MPSSIRNGGKWTEARFNSFIKGILRAGSSKWPPKWEVRKAARTARGLYKCAGYLCKAHIVTASVKVRGKRKNNVFVDHKIPIVGNSGFASWDAFIEGLYCEVDNLQVLCKACHDAKSKAEKIERKEYANRSRK